jgi:predicted outer membrane repeat protein
MNKFYFHIIFVLMVIMFTNPVLAQSTLYVDGTNISGTHNGLSWTTAYDSLSQALQAASGNSAINSIYVAKGTYQPASGKSFTMLNNVKIYGGYPTGGNGVRDTTNTVNPTILIPSANNSIIVNNHTIGNSDTLTNASVLDGFILQNANIHTNYSYGGAMYLKSVSPTIRNCVFSNNYATKGGAIYVTGSNLAAGISSPRFMFCSFKNNSSQEGGAMLLSYAKPQIVSCCFVNNMVHTATPYYGEGGAICNVANSIIANCSFTGNSVTDSIKSSSSLGPYIGGGAICNGTWDLSFQDDTLGTITNCTFTSNSVSSLGATGGGGAVLVCGSIVTNCIFWNDTVIGTNCLGNEIYNPDCGVTIISYSDISANGAAGSLYFDKSGNITGVDPMFLNTAQDNFQLQQGSPCIDLGDPETNSPGYAIQASAMDLSGNTRIQNGRIDMGAFESPYKAYRFPTSVIYVDSSNVSGTHDGQSWTTAYNSLAQAFLVAANANNLDTIKVAKGTYKPYQGSSFSMLNNVKILGGYPSGGEGLRDTSNTISPTILKPNDNRIFTNDHVIGNIDTLTNSSVLDGFILKGAGSVVTALDLLSATAIINYSTNYTPYGPAAGAGGAMYLENVTPTISHCSFINDTARIQNNIGGGAIFIATSKPPQNKNCPKISYCNFISNSAGSAYAGNCMGGAINSNSYIFISNCNFISNSARDGGAVKGAFNITNCNFMTNTANAGDAANPSGIGGAITCSLTKYVSNCIFTGNTSNCYGGAIYDANYGGSKFINCCFIANSAKQYGGAIAMMYVGGDTITNCSFTQDTALYGGAIARGASADVVTNCILWKDIATGGNGNGNECYEIVPLYSDFSIGGIFDGNVLDSTDATLFHDISIDPLFVNSADNLQLQPVSPCVNAGDPKTNDTGYPIQAGPFDLLGNPRIYGGIIDMGAYEYNPSANKNSVSVVKESNNDNYIISPNPTSGSFIISGMEENATIIISNMAGLTVLETQSNPGSKINIDTLPNGIYIITIKTNNGTLQKKIIKI